MNLKPMKISRDDNERCHPCNQFCLRKGTSIGKGLLKLRFRGSHFNPTQHWPCVCFSTSAPKGIKTCVYNVCGMPVYFLRYIHMVYIVVTCGEHELINHVKQPRLWRWCFHCGRFQLFWISADFVICGSGSFVFKTDSRLLTTTEDYSRFTGSP